MTSSVARHREIVSCLEVARGFELSSSELLQELVRELPAHETKLLLLVEAVLGLGMATARLETLLGFSIEELKK